MVGFTEYPKSKDEHKAMQIVKHMTIKDAAWSIVALEHQRDQLREALIIALETLEDEFGVNSGAANHARAALKSTEEST